MFKFRSENYWDQGATDRLIMYTHDIFYTVLHTVMAIVWLLVGFPLSIIRWLFIKLFRIKVVKKEPKLW